MGRNTWYWVAGGIGAFVLAWYFGLFCKFRPTMNTALCNANTGPGHAAVLENQLTMGGRFRSPNPTGNNPIPEGPIHGLGHNYTGAQYNNYIKSIYGGM